MEYLLSASLTFLSLILLIKQGLCLGESKNVYYGSQGILCYVCNSRDDPRCGHPFQRHVFKPVNCSDLNYMDEYGQKLMREEGKETPTLCRKNYQTVTLGGKTDTRISRGCGYISKNKPAFGVEEDEDEGESKGEERCYRKAGTFEVMITYCTCTTNECNGARKFGSENFLHLVLLPLLALTSLLLSHLPQSSRGK